MPPPYRVSVSHADPDHPNATVAHHGPAFDDTYQAIVESHLGESIDLLESASTCAGRFRAAHDESWTVEVVELVNGEWKAVS